MPWTVAYDPQIEVVVVTYTGSTTGGDLRSANAAAILLGREKGTTRFLADASGLEIVASIFDVHVLPFQQYVDEGVDRRSRIAVIQPAAPAGLDAARFYETACRNHGWNAKVFAEREVAIQWLIGEKP